MWKIPQHKASIHYILFASVDLFQVLNVFVILVINEVVTEHNTFVLHQYYSTGTPVPSNMNLQIIVPYWLCKRHSSYLLFMQFFLWNALKTQEKAMFVIIRSSVSLLEQSKTGFLNPCSKGPYIWHFAVSCTSLDPIFQDAISGKVRTFALPATSMGLPTLFCATLSISAASAWNSPSIYRSGRFSFAIYDASHVYYSSETFSPKEKTSDRLKSSISGHHHC